MRICLTGNGLTVQSGHARPAYVLARSLIDMGHAVTIVAGRMSDAALAVEETVLARLGLADLPIERRFDGLADLARGDNELIRSLWRRFAEFDVVHAFDLTTLWLLSRAFGGAFPCATVATVASDLYVDARDIARHGAGPVLRVSTHPPYLAAALAGERLLPSFLAVPDRVIATSAHTARMLSRVAAADHVRLVAQGLRWKAYRSAPPREAPPVFLYFGWLSALRGAGDAVDAFLSIAAQLPGARLKIAVRGVAENVEDRLLVRRFAGLPGVEISGFDDDVASLLAATDVVVLPFRSSFGYCQPAMTVLEAMAAGRAVISTPVGAAGEAVEHGVSGVLVPPGDVRALGDAMLALARDPARRAALGEAARARVTARHDPEASARATLAVYDEALLTGSRRGSHWERYGARASYSAPETAQAFDATRFTGPAGAAFDALERVELERGLGQGPLKVLDAGAGTARFASHLARLGHTVVAAEVSGPMLAEAARRVAGEGARVALVQADGYRLPFADGAFDAVCAVRVVNQIYADDDKLALLAELFRVVRPGGTVFFDVINATSLARLARPAGLIAVTDACRLVEEELGAEVTRVSGRLVLPETVLRATPAPLVPLVERVDSALSRVVPALATRSYVTARKRQPDELPPPRTPRALSPAQALAVSGAMLAAYAFAAVSSYLFSIECARALGPDRFGALSAVLSLQVLLAVPVHGLTAALTVVLARHREASQPPGATVTAVLVPSLLVAAGATLAAVTASDSGAAEAFLHLPARGVCLAAAWGLTQVVVIRFLRALQLTVGQAAACVAGMFAEALTRVLLFAVIVLVPLDVAGTLVVYYLPATAGLLAALWALRRVLAHRPVAIDLGELTRLATRGTGAYTLVCVLTSADVPLARHYLAPVAAGLFAAAASIAKIALLISAAVVEPRLPAVAAGQGRAQRDAIREVVLQTACLCGLWALVCLAVPAPVYRWMFGGAYAGMVSVVGPLAVAAAATGTVYAAIKCLVVSGRRWPVAGLALAVLVQAGGLATWHGSAAAAANVCVVAAGVALVAVFSATP